MGSNCHQSRRLQFRGRVWECVVMCFHSCRRVAWIISYLVCMAHVSVVDIRRERDQPVAVLYRGRYGTAVCGPNPSVARSNGLLFI